MRQGTWGVPLCLRVERQYAPSYVAIVTWLGFLSPLLSAYNDSAQSARVHQGVIVQAMYAMTRS
jgi:hypothetical protein